MLGTIVQGGFGVVTARTTAVSAYFRADFPNIGVSDPITMGGTFLVSDLLAERRFMSVGISGSSTNNRFMGINTSGQIRAASVGASSDSAYSSDTVTAGTWFSATAQFHGTNLRIAGLGTSTVTDTGVESLTLPPNQLSIGVSHTLSNAIVGRVARAFVSYGLANAEQLAMLKFGYHPEVVFGPNLIECYDFNVNSFHIPGLKTRNVAIASGAFARSLGPNIQGPSTNGPDWQYALSVPALSEPPVTGAGTVTWWT